MRVEWKPIKTAPKKKGAILLGFDGKKPFLMQWSWFFNHETQNREYQWVDEKHEWPVPMPTHWMPLPIPPEEPCT